MEFIFFLNYLKEKWNLGWKYLAQLFLGLVGPMLGNKIDVCDVMGSEGTTWPRCQMFPHCFGRSFHPTSLSQKETFRYKKTFGNITTKKRLEILQQENV